MIFFLAATLSPVPEAEDYESSELSLSDLLIRNSSAAGNSQTKRQQQPLAKSERQHDLSFQGQQQQQQQQSQAQTQSQANKNVSRY